MQLFTILSVTVAGLGLICSLTNVVEPQLMPNTTTTPTIIDCRKVNYTPKYTLTCYGLYDRYGQGNATFLKKFPCCLCTHYPDKTRCYSAQGGIIVEFARVPVVINQTQYVVAAAAIVTNQTQFMQKESLGTCVNSSDCTTSRACVDGCLKFSYCFGKKNGPMLFNKASRCCYCGQPLFGGCLNCYCSTGTSYVATKGKLTYTTANNKTVQLPGSGIFLTAVTKMVRT